MNIKVERFTSDSDSTISTIFIDGKFECFGLEDEYREEKVAKETRIPAGKYKVGVRDFGGFHERYSKKFPDFHMGMLEVLGVQGFTDILIHIGNTELNTDGCLLTGTGAYSKQGSMSVQASAGAYKRLYMKVIDAALAGELNIEYIDRDRNI